MERKNLYMTFNKKETWLEKIFVFALCLQIILYFLNNDLYFQLSGFYIPLIIALICGMPSMIKKKHHVFQIPLLIMLVLFAITSIINISKIQRGYFLSVLIGIIFLFEMSCMSFSRKRIEQLKNAYIFSALIISVLIIFVKERYYSGSTRISIKIGNNPIIDPNYLAAFLVVPFLFVANRLINYKKRKLANLIILIAIGFGVIMTGSRGAYVGIVAGFICLVFTKKLFTPKGIFVLFVLAIILAIVVFFVLPRESVERFLDVGSWFSDSSNIKRISLWENAFSLIFKSFLGFLFGFGARDTSLISLELTGVAMPSHNTYLDFCLQQGVIFFLILVFVFFRIFFGKRNKLAKSICLALLTVNLFIGSVATFAFWLNLGFAIVLLQGEQKNVQS